MPVSDLLAFWPFEDSRLWVIAIVVVAVSWAIGARRGPRSCPRCHEHNREAAIYCAQCGVKLPQK